MAGVGDGGSLTGFYPFFIAFVCLSCEVKKKYPGSQSDLHGLEFYGRISPSGVWVGLLSVPRNVHRL